MAKNYIEIKPNDREVLEVLASLEKQMGNINTKEVFNEKALNKYVNQAKELLDKIELCENNIDLLIKTVNTFDNFNYTVHKEFQIYSAYVKKATIFVYEFREWITGEEIQFVIQFQGQNGELQYMQIKIQDLIPHVQLYLQKGKRGGLLSGRTKLQITNDQMQQIASKFLLDNKSILRISEATGIVKKEAARAKISGMGTGRIFETVLENIANDVKDFSVEKFKWTEIERIPGLRAGDITAEVGKKLIQLGVLNGEDSKDISFSLKTVSNIAENTEIQNINQVKADLFNIIAISKGFNKNSVKNRLKNLFTNTKEGPAKAKKGIANALGLVVNKNLSEITKFL